MSTLTPLTSILTPTLLFTLNTQNTLQPEDKDNLYWQPAVKIDYAHFLSNSDVDCIKYNEKYGLKMSANIQLKATVDIPTSHLSKKIKKRTGNDKVYMAPVFCKSCSCLLSEDAVEWQVYRLLFDVAELNARGARKELIETQSQMNINNANPMLLTTIKNKWDERMRATWSSIYQEVLIQKKENAFSDWRILIDELLATHQDYSTQPDDIKRLILGVPIVPDYVQAPTIVGDLKEKHRK